MQFDNLTLFPDVIHHYSSESILGRAQDKKLIAIKAHNFRKHSDNKWGHIDDKPYGGGPGMVIQVGPVFETLRTIKAIKAKFPKGKKGSLKIEKVGPITKIIIMDPAGKKFDQRLAEKFAKLERLVIIAGRYEGFDARIYKLADERVSIGDFVLAGGELPALAIVEATARLPPGVLGNEASLAEETFGRTPQRALPIGRQSATNKHADDKETIKEYPQYTRPENFYGWKVPAVLLRGDHKKIADWRKKNS